MRCTLLIACAVVCTFLLTGDAAAGEKRVGTVTSRPACGCGDDCACLPGQCPGKCPLQFVSGDPFEKCPNGQCPRTARPATASYASPVPASPSLSSNREFRPVRGLIEAVQNRPKIVDAVFPNRPRLFIR